MGLRGIGAKPKIHAAAPLNTDWPGDTRADRVIRFIESLRITSGMHAGKQFILRQWEQEIIRAWYATDADDNRIVRTALLSMARKNGKTANVSNEDKFFQ